jgi:hypothetical protein
MHHNQSRKETEDPNHGTISLLYVHVTWQFRAVQAITEPMTNATRLSQILGFEIFFCRLGMTIVGISYEQVTECVHYTNQNITL